MLKELKIDVYSSDIEFDQFQKLYRKYAAEPYSQRVIMTINDKMRYEKLQYDSKRAAENISALLSGKV